MSQVHEGLPDIGFESLSGLIPIEYCRDSGLLATEECRSDVRGNRTLTNRCHPPVSHRPDTHAPDLTQKR